MISSASAVSGELTNASKATTFTTFAEEFSKITQDYANTIREHYAGEHEENLTYAPPAPISGTSIRTQIRPISAPIFRRTSGPGHTTKSWIC